jgi:hypothetical protein
VYPNNGQSLAELAELAPDVVDEAVVVVVVDVVAGEADFSPLQAVAASATEPISTARLTSSIAPTLIARRDAITVQAASASGCQRERLSLRARSQRACSTRSGVFKSLQSWHRSDAVRRRGSGNSPPQARQMNGLWLNIDHLLVWGSGQDEMNDDPDMPCPHRGQRQSESPGSRKFRSSR